MQPKLFGIKRPSIVEERNERLTFGTFSSYRTNPIPDGHLRLDREEESSDEIVHILNTRPWSFELNESEPCRCKNQPGNGETNCEKDHEVGPFGVTDRVKNIPECLFLHARYISKSNSGESAL